MKKTKNINKHLVFGYLLLSVAYGIFNARVLHGGFLAAVIAGVIVGVLVRRVWEWTEKE